MTTLTDEARQALVMVLGRLEKLAADLRASPQSKTDLHFFGAYGADRAIGIVHEVMRGQGGIGDDD